MEDSKRHDLNSYARNVIRHSARKLIGRYGFIADDYEDLMQELSLDLLIRLPNFDPSKATQNTFIAQTVTRAVSKLVRHRHRQKRDYRREAWSLDEALPNGEGDAVPRGETVSKDDFDLRSGKHGRPNEERLDLRLDISLGLSGLDPDLQHLADRLRTTSVADVARELGIPRSSLYDQGIARIRRAFEGRGLTVYLATNRRFDQERGR